jgi:V/A-type H+-transporting ATPase subunit E
MALAEILAAMESEADAEIKRILSGSAESVAQIRATAEAEAGKIRERRRREILVGLEQERSRRLNRARLDQIRVRGQAQERVFEDIMSGVRSILIALRSRTNYAAILQALVAEALEQIDGDAIIHSDPRDENVLRSWLPTTRIEFNLNTMGGVEAHTPDDRIVVVNTLEARLEQGEEILRQVVLPLFEAGGEEWVSTTMPMPESVR